ncbi:kinase-like domain-containing protein [Dunaliella salina]|uniref:mitogen-activated protein kinase kinase n=1 Tax=Dunaliella salina TaxID=3046 RepID=A0ABQ7G7T4_DUNSA|nr:kinase-like domain-containing protein [Dunaliella salina]|eukprot:KAF5830666.1 kinase-like domain-containing protein [Dunaliella salina]
MPLPKLQLQLPVNESQQSVNESQQLRASINFNGSLRTNQDEVTVLTRSYNPYNFTTEGFTSKGSNGGQHYKISEKDIWIIRRQGSGASSTVFKGFHFRENRFVAVKKINVLDRETRHQMLNDVKALCDARAVPGLIAFAGAFHMPDSGQIAIVLEYMDGGSLQDVLEKVGSIPEDILSLITARILVGLTYLHRQKHMVHRDIKPGNILVNSDGDPKITDFGISAFIDSTLAVCNTFLGTVTYMSPERINNEQYSFSADIWSLGLVLIECATGKYPYDASVGPLQLMIQVLNDDLPLPEGPNVSPQFKDFLAQCLRKNPYERPTAEQLLQHPFITKHASAPPGRPH